MKRTLYLIMIVSISIFITLPALAKDPVVYPAQGQSQDQMEKDKFDCYGWAKKESGFDPMATAEATSPPPPQQQPTANAGRGAVGGGLAGLAIGSLSGNAGRGAAIGAVTGAVVGGARRSKQEGQQQQANQQWAQQEAAQYAANRDGYNRAFSACMSGKGYSVK